MPGAKDMITVNTHEAKTTLSALLAKIEEENEEIIICRNGKPVAKMVAISKRSVDPLRPTPELGPIVFHEDPCAPLDEDAWPKECR
jgi:antitoxin (DNA-binding transcriptional repressor) of toxin-antitoxin stability system